MNKYLIIIILVLNITNAAYPKIYKVYRNGTVYYYNRKPASIKRNKRNKRRRFSTKYDHLIKPISKRYKLDYRLIKCIIQVESNFNKDAISDAGAMGLMQLMQSTGDYYDMQNPFDPEENLTIGIRHFKGLMKYFKNNVPLSLAAYHAGLGRVKKNMAIPPIKSTISYVNKIMKLYTGNGTYSSSVKKLYKRIRKDGTLVIYSK